MEIKLVDIDALVLNPKNSNKHPKEQIERLAKLIKHHGFRQPVIVSNRSGFVIAGHGRIESAKMAGLGSIPVLYQDFDSEASEYAFLTSDNAIARWSEIDMAMINSELVNFPELDIDLLGIKEFNITPIHEFEMEEELKDDMNKKFIIEITFPNDMEMMDIHDDLTSRGYIVKIK